MSELATTNENRESYDTPLTPENWGKLGMWIFLAGDAMSFGTILSVYGAIRATSSDWPVPGEILGITLTALMTFLLIVSSVTMVHALSAIRKGDQKAMTKFLGLTILGGAIFLSLQAYEWNHLIHEGLGFSSNPFGAPLFGTTFFAITGFHGMHVFGGIVYLSVIFFNGTKGAYSAENYRNVEIVGLYWHFVDLVWILVFTFVYLL